MGSGGAAGSGRERRLRVVGALAYGFGAVALLVTLILGAWTQPFGVPPIVVGAGLLAAHRALGRRFQSDAAWFFTHLALTAGFVLVAPLGCLYAFLAYIEAGDRLRGRWTFVGIALAAPLCAWGETGGFAGFQNAPWLFVAVLAANLAIAPAMAWLGRSQDTEVTRREDAVAQLEREQSRSAALQALLMEQAREAGVQDERERLSREIHDTVAQGLIGVITQLESIGPELGASERQARIDRASDVARQSLAEARRAIQALGSPLLVEDDLPRALTQTAREWSERTGIGAKVVVDGRPRAGVQDEALLRVAQESLANAARHSGASRATIALSYSDGETRLDVHDDGRGFDPASLQEGTGISGMRARLAGIGGTLELEASEGRGCTVCAAVPE